MIRIDARLVDGRPRLEAVHSQFNEYFERAGGSDESLLADVNAWKRHNPNSAAAPIVEAIAWRSRAWAARGRSFSGDVAGQGWAIFQDKLTKAQAILAANKARSDSNPMWYVESMIVARGLGWERRRVSALYDEGIRKFPDNYSIERQMLMYLSPKWNGSYQTVARFINAAASAAPHELSAITYARLYWQLQEIQEVDGRDYFVQSNAVWPRMKRGFLTLFQQYPGSYWNLNHFASFACMADDAPTYRDVRQRIGAQIYVQAWTRRYPAAICDKRFKVSIAAPAANELPSNGFKMMQKPAVLDGIGAWTWVGMSFVDQFETRHFAELDASLAKAASLGDRFVDGSSRLEAAAEAFYIYFSDSNYSAEFQQALRQWREQVPGSTQVASIEALFWRTSAWMIQGDHDASRTTAAGRKLFRADLNKSLAVLQQSKDSGASDPLWRREYLYAARGLGWEPKRMRRTFDDAVAKFPNFVPLYRIMATTLAPRWGGSYGAVEVFAQDSINHTQSQMGAAMYPAIYQEVDSTDGPRSQLFRDSKVSWPTMRRGFEDLLRRYPNSLWNSNWYASYACQAGDSESYQRMRKRIGNMIYKQLWPTNLSPVVCDAALTDKHSGPVTH